MTNDEKKPTLTYTLIVICFIVFLLELYYQYTYGEEFLNKIFYTYGFSYQSILDKRFEVLITSIFLHGSPDHLILNVVALFFFGKVVELELGKKKFLLIFFLSSIVGDLAVLFLTVIGLMSPLISTIGVSATVFGLMGAAMLIKPFDLIFYPYLIPIPLILVALIYTLYNIAEFLLILTTTTESNISYISHIGGLVCGMLFGFREEGSRKGFIILLFLLLLLITTPFLFTIFKFLEAFNYVNVLSSIFGKK